MRLRPLASGLSFLLVLLTARPAFARDSVDEIAAEIFNYLADIRPAHLFAAACVFLVIGIFAKARESSGFIVFGSFFMTALCVAAFLIFALTGDLMGGRMRRHAKSAAAESAQEAPAPAHGESGPGERAKEPEVVNASAKVGDSCKRNSDCNRGTICAKVAGVKNCWEPCNSGGQCEPGFACMVSSAKESVCVH